MLSINLSEYWTTLLCLSKMLWQSRFYFINIFKRFKYTVHVHVCQKCLQVSTNLHTSQVAHQASTYLWFLQPEEVRSISTPPPPPLTPPLLDGMLVHLRVTPRIKIRRHSVIHLGGEACSNFHALCCTHLTNSTYSAKELKEIYLIAVKNTESLLLFG